jgi:Fe-S-cluster containining protein
MMRIQDASGIPIDIQPGVVNTIAGRIYQSLSTELTAAQARSAVEELYDVSDDLLRRLQKQDKPQLACKRGCAWCCFSQVAVGGLEVLRLYEYIRHTFTEEQINALQDRVEAVALKAKGLSVKQHEALKVPCPLLVGNQCSGYSARPLACRGWNSFSAVQCQKLYDSPGNPNIQVLFYAPMRDTAASIATGMQVGIYGLGLQQDWLSLPIALDIAFRTPDCADRFLSGEPVFAKAILG